MAPRNPRQVSPPINCSTGTMVAIGLFIFAAWVFMVPSQPGLKISTQNAGGDQYDVLLNSSNLSKSKGFENEYEKIEHEEGDEEENKKIQGVPKVPGTGDEGERDKEVGENKPEEESNTFMNEIPIDVEENGDPIYNEGETFRSVSGNVRKKRPHPSVDLSIENFVRELEKEETDYKSGNNDANDEETNTSENDGIKTKSSDSIKESTNGDGDEVEKEETEKGTKLGGEGGTEEKDVVEEEEEEGEGIEGKERKKFGIDEKKKEDDDDTTDEENEGDMTSKNEDETSSIANVESSASRNRSAETIMEETEDGEDAEREREVDDGGREANVTKTENASRINHLTTDDNETDLDREVMDDMDEESNLDLFFNNSKVNNKGQITRWGEVISKDSILSSKSDGVELRDENLKAEPKIKALSPNATSPLNSPSLPYCPPNQTNTVPCLRGVEMFERKCFIEPNKKLCLVPKPVNYRPPNSWPESLTEVWSDNLLRPNLQKWGKNFDFLLNKRKKFRFVSNSDKKGDVESYIKEIIKSVPEIGFGKHVQVVLDVRSGFASFSAYLSKLNATVLSISHKDQIGSVQIALERGLPSFLASFASSRLPFPSLAFDMIHCFKCRVSWADDGGKHMLEAYRILRPEGYFIWTYENQKFERTRLEALAKSICMILVSKSKYGDLSFVIFKKLKLSECSNPSQNQKGDKSSISLCKKKDDPDLVWQSPLKRCVYPFPSSVQDRGAEWTPVGEERKRSPPKWVQDIRVPTANNKPTLEAYMKDQHFWDRVVWRTYVPKFGIEWNNLRNVMDMNALYGSFAIALSNFPLWVMNVVSTDVSNTLGVIYDRGLIGVNHNWCDPFDSYPRTYDLIHSNNVLSFQSKSCELLGILVEVDRLLRPNAFFIVRDEASFVASLVETAEKELGWRVNFLFNRVRQTVVLFQKYVGELPP